MNGCISLLVKSISCRSWQICSPVFDMALATFPSEPRYKFIVDLLEKWIPKPLSRRFSNPPPVVFVAPTETVSEPMATSHSTFMLPDGAKLAYEILGSFHIGRTVPIVLLCGMTSVRADFERLTASLIKTRPVLLYDHRGIGDSSLAPTKDEDITIELLARDLLALLVHLSWKEVSLCGFSMGGVIAQQMLVLPYHPTSPTTIPFRVTHLFLSGTRCVVQTNAGLRISPPAPNATRTREERIAIARRVVSSLVDPKWIEANGERFDYIFKRAINPKLIRPTDIVTKQGAALQKFNFVDLLPRMPSDLKTLIIHGNLDQVIPPSCGQDTLKCIPSGQFIEEGSLPGQVPSLDFGHFWFEYFEVKVWHDVIDKFIASAPVVIQKP